MAGFWTARFWQAMQKEGEGAGGVILRAGRGAVPYLMRQRRWEEAATLLEQVIQRDKSPATVAGALPLLARIVEATEGTVKGPASTGIFARALVVAGRTDEAADRMRGVEQQATELGQHRLAGAAAADLMNLLRDAGHFEEALAAVERKKGHTRRAGLGRWTQLLDECQRLQILNELGRYEEVLAAVLMLREEIRSWPESGSEDEAVGPWNVREVLLDTGRKAALGLERWEEALSLNGEILSLTVSRGATKLEVARTKYNDYGPLLRLERYGDARSLLYQCLAVFESDGGSVELGSVHSAIANLESNLEHFPEAIRHGGAAIRYLYSVLVPGYCAISHFNLANYLLAGSADAPAALAHRLAAALIWYQMDHGELPSTLEALRQHLALASPGDIPASFDELCARVEQTEGVRFRDLFSRLPRRAPSGDEALLILLNHGKHPR